MLGIGNGLKRKVSTAQTLRIIFRFYRHHVRGICRTLVAAASEVCELRYSKFSDVLADRGIDVPHEDPEFLEIYAKFQASGMDLRENGFAAVLQGWRQSEKDSDSHFRSIHLAADIET